MDFFSLIKKFFIFTLKEIYSFFLKLGLLILFLFILGVSLVTFIATSEKKFREVNSKDYNYVLFNPTEVNEDKIITPSIFVSQIILNNSDFEIKRVSNLFMFLNKIY